MPLGRELEIDFAGFLQCNNVTQINGELPRKRELKASLVSTIELEKLALDIVKNKVTNTITTIVYFKSPASQSSGVMRLMKLCMRPRPSILRHFFVDSKDHFVLNQVF